MASYRVYFLSGNYVRGREDFEADSDADALVTTEAVFDACSDAIQSFDLWCGERSVVAGHQEAITLSDVIERRQGNVMALEESIRNSKWAVASSRRLLLTLNAAKERWRPAN